MLKKICKKIESKRDSKNLFWNILVLSKDTLWLLTIIFLNIILFPIIIVLIIIEIEKQKKETKKIKKQFKLNIADNKEEVRLFIIVKNEAERIPFFLQYYREAGVDRFFFLNNESTDNTAEILKKEKDVYFFDIKGKLNEFEMIWQNAILENYGNNHWCINVDIDEFLVFPYTEN